MSNVSNTTMSVRDQAAQFAATRPLGVNGVGRAILAATTDRKARR